jgi:hypothetical protein
MPSAFHPSPRETSLSPDVGPSSPLKKIEDLRHASDQRREDASDGTPPQPCEPIADTELTRNDSADSDFLVVTENVRFLRERLTKADIL